MFVWKDDLYDVPISQIKKEIYSTSYNGIVFVEHDWKQLKKSMEWYERQCNLCGYNQEVILREINLKRLAGSNMSPFTREQQLYLSSHVRSPIEEVPVKAVDNISYLSIYEKFNRRIPYIIGIDPAEGLSEDNNAMIVINPFTYKVVAEYKCPYISPKEFANFIVKMMDDKCPRSLLVIESNRGRELIQRISDTHYRNRIWYDADRMNQLLSEKTDKYGGIPNSVLNRKVQGFVTSTKSRNLLFGCLENMVMENIDCIYSEHLVNEILTLIRKPTGKIEAAPGEHDDCVMAYLIGLYVYLNASNLEEFGVSRRMRSPDEEHVREKEDERSYRARVRSQMSEIPEQYRGIFEDFLKERDPLRDARDYAAEMAQAQEQEDFLRNKYDPRYRGATGSFQGEDEISFDRQIYDAEEEPKVGMPFMHMGGRQRLYNKEEDYGYDVGPVDLLSQAERDSFEMGIFRGNFREDPENQFDPDDWV
jgi:hypothetical protein